jgi:DNA-binding transcriptional MerR regulator
MEQPQTLRPGQLARLALVSTDTFRHYERRGLLLSRRSSNGYREYPQEALERVRLVQRALSVGFSLDELARVFRIRERGGAPCQEVRALAAAKLHSMEEQIRELIALRDHLRELIEEWDARLAGTPKGKRALLLENWSAAPARTDGLEASVIAAGKRERHSARALTTAQGHAQSRGPASRAAKKGSRLE